MVAWFYAAVALLTMAGQALAWEGPTASDILESSKSGLVKIIVTGAD